jgi:hypothetical protein
MASTPWTTTILVTSDKHCSFLGYERTEYFALNFERSHHQNNNNNNNSNDDDDDTVAPEDEVDRGVFLVVTFHNTMPNLVKFVARTARTAAVELSSSSVVVGICCWIDVVWTLNGLLLSSLFVTVPGDGIFS